MSNFITNGELRIEAERLCDENERLQAENAKLREQVTQLQSDWESERDYADQMEAKEKRAVAENARLREALESVLKCAGEIKRNSGCDICPMYNEDGSFADHSWCRLRPELRNLGFEVKE